MTADVVGRRVRLVHPVHGRIVGVAKADPRGVFVQFPGGAVDFDRMTRDGWRYAIVGSNK